jgi:hypothetical protein
MLRSIGHRFLFPSLSPSRASSTTSSNGILKTVLYGKQPVDAAATDVPDEERTTFSKRLARGKYVHELQGGLGDIGWGIWSILHGE